MSKERTGFTVERAGRLYVRICYVDSLGKRRELMRRAQDRKHARELKKQLVKQLDSAGGNQRLEIDGQKVTFREVAERYKEQKLIEAVYVNDRKVAGLRSVKSPKTYLKRLLEHFGAAKVRSITHSQVDEYRLKRLSEGLTIASVNRELALLRSIFNFAKREGFITRTPFEMGSPLISAADETKRDRTLSREEEERLLLALSDEALSHLRPLVIAALDTGCRRGELLKLKWNDVDLEGGVIRLKAFNVKTARSRQVPISDRLKDELQGVRSDDSDSLVFNSRNLRRGWEAACKAAGVEGLRLHDLRASFITRMISLGMAAVEVSKISGHTQIQTLYGHYLRVTNGTLERAASLLNRMNGAEGERKGED